MAAGRTAPSRVIQALLIAIASAAALAGVLHQLSIDWMEASLFDLRTVHGPQIPADPSIVLIRIDDKSTAELNEAPPLSIDSHARLLEELERQSPRAVGYLVDFGRVNENSPEQMGGESALRFLEAARRIEAKGSTFLIGTPLDVTGEVLPPFPLSTLPHAVAIVHRDGNVFAEDKVTRRALVSLYDRPSFQLELARRIGIQNRDHQPRGTYLVPETGASYFFFRYHGSGESYASFTASDVLARRIPEGALRGKILLVGSTSLQDSSDYAFTPYSSQPFTQSKLGVHAVILDSIIHDDGILRLPGWVGGLITFALVSFVIAWVLVSKPLYGVFATFGIAIVFSLLAFLLFGSQSIWMRMSQPLLGVFFAYYLAVPYRLIREYKKRWDYQRRNQILLQVEELKRNFLSLVTHDLKTPVARIQGLAEVLLSKAGGRLIPRDQETLQHIIEATDELNHFITSILELSRVESQDLRLNLESRDVNQLIEKLLEGFKAQARVRKIRIHTDLEPLFPIRIDPELITKVLRNLVDNALKYSPAGSEVLIESREEGRFVRISVRDQGVGMSREEQDQLFTRFFRATNDATSRNPGTGLGLYLTRFFVHAHQGKVEVESAPGRGSTFSIFLPLEIDAARLTTRQDPPPQPGLRTSLPQALPSRTQEHSDA